MIGDPSLFGRSAEVFTQTFSTRENRIPRFQWEENTASSLTISVPQLRLVLAMFLAVPAGLGIRVFKGPTARHLYATVVGFALVYYPFGAGVGQAIFPAVAAYIAMALAPKRCGIIAWCTCFPYLVWLHVISATGMRWTLGEPDFDGGVMVLTLKLISMAVAHQDANTVKDEKQLSRHAKEHLVRHLPSPLPYLGFVFCFGNLLAGPQIEFAKYLEFIEGKGVWDARKRPAPSPWGYALRLTLQGALFMAGHVVLMGKWGLDMIRGDWYKQQPLRMRCFAQVMCGLAHQQKYYMAWKLMEASLTLGGLNLTGWESGKAVWGRYSNMSFRGVWLSSSARTVPQKWNITTGHFLRYYVYERIAPKNGKPGFIHLVVTQLVAGTWHGMYPGYLLFFMSTVLYLQGGTVMYRMEQGVLPGLIANSWLWWLLKVLYTDWTLNYLAMAFILLEYHTTIEAWTSVNFLPHWIMLGLVLVGLLVPSPSKRKSGESAGNGATAGQDSKKSK